MKNSIILGTFLTFGSIMVAHGQQAPAGYVSIDDVEVEKGSPAVAVKPAAVSEVAKAPEPANLAATKAGAPVMTYPVKAAAGPTPMPGPARAASSTDAEPLKTETAEAVKPEPSKAALRAKTLEPLVAPESVKVAAPVKVAEPEKTAEPVKAAAGPTPTPGPAPAAPSTAAEPLKTETAEALKPVPSKAASQAMALGSLAAPESVKVAAPVKVVEPEKTAEPVKAAEPAAAPPKPVFIAREGASLHDTLERWAKEAGWKQVSWKLPADLDFTLGTGGRFEGDFMSATRTFVDALGCEAELRVLFNPTTKVALVEPL